MEYKYEDSIDTITMHKKDSYIYNYNVKYYRTHKYTQTHERIKNK